MESNAQAWGRCGERTSAGQYRDSAGQWVHYCPISQTDWQAQQAVSAWVQYHAGGMGKGPLPYVGGWLDMPAWVGIAFGVCDSEYAKIEEIRRKQNG